MRAAREFYESDAARRVQWDGRDPVIHQRNRMALALLPDGRRCVDVGCGSGGLAPLLAEKFTFVSGVDLSLTLARTAGDRGMRGVCADLDESSLPFADASFDAAVCFDVLEHVFDPVQFVQRVVRVIRPGGSFVVSVPNIRYLPRVLSLAGGYFPRTTGDPNGYDGGHLHYFTTRNVAEVFEAAGLRDVIKRGFNADPSRRSRVVTWGLRIPMLEPAAREFGCSTIVVAGRRPAAGDGKLA